MLKIPQARLQQYMNNELTDVQAGFRKGRGTRNQIANIYWIIKKAREFLKTSICALLTAKAFDCVDQNKLWKILKAMGIPDYPTFTLRNLYVSQESTVRTGLGTMEKEFNKAVCRHPACLTSMQSTSCEMPGWMNHNLESRLLREISTNSDMQMIPP